VAAAVILRNGRYLITLRPSKGLLGGMWEFPGGKQEPGEDLPACLKREIMEELGTRVRVGEELGVFEHAYTHFSVTVHAFTCRLTGREPQPLQVSDLRWVKAAEMDGFPMGKVDRLISKKISTTY
jgi:A/G-specific adenine glycosylase